MCARKRQRETGLSANPATVAVKNKEPARATVRTPPWVTFDKEITNLIFVWEGVGSGIIGPPRYCMGMPLCLLGREGCSGSSQCLRTRGLRDAMYVLSGGKPREMQVLICIRIGTRSLWYKIRKAFEFPSHWSRFGDPGSEAVARPTRSRWTP